MDNEKILIVEDENIVALHIKKVIEVNGYACAGICTSGEDAIDLYPSVNPDLVLMDILLSGEIDGIECAQHLRATYDAPIILLTAYADKETIERAKHIDPFGYIVKPFTDRDLALTLELALYRQKMEKALRASENRYRRFFANDLSGNFATDGEGIIIECNAAFLRLLHIGYAEQVKGENISTFLSEQNQWERLIDVIQRDTTIELAEFELTTANGSKTRVLANVVGFFEGDRFSGIQGYFIDITEKTHLEEQLRQAQKMEAIGRLAGGIAHDFNNIITVILGYSSLLEEKDAGEDSGSYEVQGIRQAALKATNLTRQLLAFSRKTDLKAETINLHLVIRNMEHMLKRLLAKNININLYLNAPHSLVYVDPGQFEQVLMNLAVNASDAMPSGGRITISTNNEDNFLVISFRDTGIGIDEKIRANIFEPFFTTKPESEGTGLGLSTVYGILQQSGGTIELKENEGGGARFDIHLPLSEKEADKSEKEVGDRTETGGSELIMVVVEDSTLRDLFTQVLTSVGYSVFSSGSAEEAIRICETRDAALDLLLTDTIMHHMNGDELASRLRSIIPKIKVLYITGYQDGQTAAKQIDIDTNEVLMKPFQPPQLLNRIRELLDEPASKLLS